LKLDERIIVAIEPSLNHAGYDIVDVNIIGGKRFLVGINIERFDGTPVTLDDCVAANHLVSAIFDVEDFIKGPYNLEISSPGEYRPLKKISDFERFCGKNVKIELLSVVDGKRKICGRLLKVEQNTNDIVVYLKEECDTGGVEIKVPYDGIKKASVKRF
jgi:ribosome maturation factor RimP